MSQILNNIFINFENLKNKNFYSEENIKKLIYFSNKNNVKDLLHFSVCIYNKSNYLNILRLLDYVDNCNIPKFPISGDYLKKYGYKSGLEMGKKLKFLEEKWISNNFILDKKFLEKSLKKDNRN